MSGSPLQRVLDGAPLKPDDLASAIQALHARLVALETPRLWPTVTTTAGPEVAWEALPPTATTAASATTVTLTTPAAAEPEEQPAAPAKPVKKAAKKATSS